MTLRNTCHDMTWRNTYDTVPPHGRVSIIRNGKNVRRQFADFLLPVDFDLIHRVDGENLVGIDGHQNGARVCVDDILVVPDQQVSRRK